MALVIVGERPASALFDGQARLGTVKRLNLRLFIDTQHHRMHWGRYIKPHYIVQFSTKAGSFDSLKARQRCGARP